MRNGDFLGGELRSWRNAIFVGVGRYRMQMMRFWMDSNSSDGQSHALMGRLLSLHDVNFESDSCRYLSFSSSLQ